MGARLVTEYCNNCYSPYSSQSMIGVSIGWSIAPIVLMMLILLWMLLRNRNMR